MEYTLSPNCQNAIASLRTLDQSTFDSMVQWCIERRKSVKAGLMCEDQAYDQRLAFLHQLLDIEAYWRAIADECLRRENERQMERHGFTI
jgi:hypothetical protein